MRKHKTQRPNDMRRSVEQHFTLDQRLTHEPEFVVLKVTQSSMHQLARARRGTLRQVVLLAQNHRQPASRSIARNARAVDATANDEQVDHLAVVHLTALRSTS